MPVESEIKDDYILYKVLCDYCDEKYSIKCDSETIDYCPFCGNMVEDLTNRGDRYNENSWD